MKKTGLSYLGKAGVGGNLGGSTDAVNDPPVGGLGRTQRFLNGPGNPQALWDNTTNGTFYMGFLVNFGTVLTVNGVPTGAMGYHAIEMFPEHCHLRLARTAISTLGTTNSTAIWVPHNKAPPQRKWASTPKA